MSDELWPYQKEAVEYILSKRRVLVGDEVGLGKSVVALAALSRADAFPAVIVCPSFLVPHWHRMVERWLRPNFARYAQSLYPTSGSLVRIVSYDSLFERDERVIPEPGFTYDVGKPKKKPMRLSALGRELVDAKPKGIVVDESSYVKTGKAKRTKAVKAIARSASIRILLSATAVENAPRELISQLDILGVLDRFGGSWDFLMRYCDAKKTAFGYWDFTGFSNLMELHSKMVGLCYIKRTKKMVQQYLPEHRREVIPIEIVDSDLYRSAEDDVIAWVKAHDGLEAADRATKAEALVRVNVLRQLVAELKMEASVEWIQSLLDSGEKVVVFCYHKDYAKRVAARFEDSLLISGDLSVHVREEALRKFRENGSPIIVVTIKAGGMGIDLTPSSNCVFLESAWTASQNDQAEGRLHRHGQTKSVTAWLLHGVAEGGVRTIDNEIYKLVEKKRKMMAGVLDGVEMLTTLDMENEAVAVAKALAERGHNEG